MENTTYIFNDGTVVKSYDDFGLRKTERTKISPPKPDAKPFRTPGTNGRRDYLRLMGAPLTYEPRTLTDVFIYPKRQRVWEALKSKVYARLNGQTCRIILDRHENPRDQEKQRHVKRRYPHAGSRRDIFHMSEGNEENTDALCHVKIVQSFLPVHVQYVIDLTYSCLTAS